MCFHFLDNNGQKFLWSNLASYLILDIWSYSHMQCCQAWSTRAKVSLKSEITSDRHPPIISPIKFVIVLILIFQWTGIQLLTRTEESNHKKDNPVSPILIISLEIVKIKIFHLHTIPEGVYCKSVMFHQY